MGLKSSENTISFKSSYKKTFEEVKNALSECKFKIKEENEKTGTIKVSAGISFSSWGESMTVCVVKTSSGTKVNVYSGSKAQLFDWGKNKKNIDKLFNDLSKRLKK